MYLHSGFYMKINMGVKYIENTIKRKFCFKNRSIILIMIRELLTKILVSTIEDDYTRLEHIRPELYSSLQSILSDEEIFNVTKEILYNYIKEDIVCLYYENWKEPNLYIKIDKFDAEKLVFQELSWNGPNTNDICIVARVTKKGEELYYSGEILTKNFKFLPEIESLLKR